MKRDTHLGSMATDLGVPLCIFWLMAERRDTSFSPQDNIQFTWTKISEKCIKSFWDLRKKNNKLNMSGQYNSRACHSSRCCTFSFYTIVFQSNSDTGEHVLSSKSIISIQIYPNAHPEKHTLYTSPKTHISEPIEALKTDSQKVSFSGDHVQKVAK